MTDQLPTTWLTAAGNITDRRKWLRSPHNAGNVTIVTLDLSTFEQPLHYPDGYLPSGIVLGRITATGKYGPADDTATDGRETARSILYDPVLITDDTEPAASTWSGGGYVRGHVNVTYLPVEHAAGSATFNARHHLHQITFDN